MENSDLKLTAEAWADIVIKNWLTKIDQLRINYSYQLSDSFLHHIVANAGGDLQRIEFAFAYYGRMVDMGVGKGVKIAMVKERRFEGFRRRPKPWYSVTLYSEVKKLREILQRKYALKTTTTT
ncbi:MAG TPA: hypothetical protein P5184_04610, partial [Bacteroidales bacterium]|nr:hypothetical protein [Bacteroidales bacterium]